MFDIGIQELIVVFIVALLVFGPKRLPELGRTLGKFLSEIRKGINDARYQMESEFKEIRQPTPDDRSAKKEVQTEESPEQQMNSGEKGEKA